MTLDTRPSTNSRRSMGVVAIVLSLTVISALHYVTSLHSVVLHEIFKRFYYVPIVVAAVTAGSRGGIATSLLATLLYLPHVVLQWHAWPIEDVDQYGEVLMFNVVAIITGMLADRLHAERKRYRDTAVELREASANLEARNEERLRVDRLVTVGRIASGIAHEINTPLGGLLGSLEILEAEFPRAHPKAEFVEIAKREIARLQQLVRDFLEFAQPTPPTVQGIDLRLVVETAARLARPALASRGVDVEVRPLEAALTVRVDAQQVERALLIIILGRPTSLRDGCVVIAIRKLGDMGQVTLEFDGAASPPGLGELFEPFPATSRSHGLALATARRLLENQQGTVRAEIVDAKLRYVIDLPLATESGETTADPPVISPFRKAG